MYKHAYFLQEIHTSLFPGWDASCLMSAWYGWCLAVSHLVSLLMSLIHHPSFTEREMRRGAGLCWPALGFLPAKHSGCSREEEKKLLFLEGKRYIPGTPLSAFCPASTACVCWAAQVLSQSSGLSTI